MVLLGQVLFRLKETVARIIKGANVFYGSVAAGEVLYLPPGAVVSESIGVFVMNLVNACFYAQAVRATFGSARRRLLTGSASQFVSSPSGSGWLLVRTLHTRCPAASGPRAKSFDPKQRYSNHQLSQAIRASLLHNLVFRSKYSMFALERLGQGERRFALSVLG